MLGRLTVLIAAAWIAALFAVSRPIAGAVGAEPGLTVGVLSFNIRFDTPEDGDNAWPKRRQRVIDTIRAVTPPADGPRSGAGAGGDGGGFYDFVCLQEALRPQIDQILNGVPAYDAVGVGRDDGKQAGEYTPILYRREHWELVGTGTFWLSETPEKPGSATWGNRVPRICTWATFRNAGRTGRFTSGRLVTVFNTHLDHESQASRERGVELIAQRIAEIAPQGPLVVCGDLNVGPDNRVIEFLLGKRARAVEGEEMVLASAPSPRLDDTFAPAAADAKETGTFNGFDGSERGGARIDYVLVRGATSPRGWIDRRVWEGKPASDHWAVGAAMGFERPAAAGGK